jgi:hypothetical protein
VEARRRDLTPLRRASNAVTSKRCQTWRTGRAVGKYGLRNQYWYTCPTAARSSRRTTTARSTRSTSRFRQRASVIARAAEAEDAGRVRYGFERYGKRPLQVTTNNISGVACRVRGVDDPLFAQTGSLTTALVSPWLVRSRRARIPQSSSAAEEVRARLTATISASLASIRFCTSRGRT